MNKKIIIAIISLLIIGGLIIFIYKNISIEKNKEDRYCQNCDSRQRNTGLNDIIRILLLILKIKKPSTF